MEERIGSRMMMGISDIILSLNPYCNGRKNRMIHRQKGLRSHGGVLILIVVEERIGFNTQEITQFKQALVS